MSIYFKYPGVIHRYAYDWKGGAGGIMHNTRAADTLALGAADLLESGYGDPNWQGYYQLQELMQGVGTDLQEFSIVRPLPKPTQARAHATGDYMGFRLDGPEPIDPMPVSGIPIWDGLSDNEKIVVAIAAGAGAWWLWKKRKRRGRR